tara:strand:- start:144 stop:452 length:309 start_codon:yes stop_codon:yes gene_type:complete
MANPNGINEPVVTDAHDCDAHLSNPLGVFQKRVCLLCYPNAVKGFYSRQNVPTDHLAGNELHQDLKGAEVIGYVTGGTYNSIQIKLTSGRVVKMWGFFTEGY